ncbi:MAG: acyl-CoA dehydrogenase family protein [Alphaproteobacteria bacterium]|nr:acyl-CoA dehydrogenase family protein [Alphaproteobacteria bacterium]MBV8408368.1 acyl-CoA dehydrogenase family protein [Alphaproteobacteria bacterium]
MTGDGDNPLLQAARALRPVILAAREHVESDRRLPQHLTDELARKGFFRLFLPQAYGGLDLAPLQGLEVLEELGRADASVAWCVWNGNTHWVAAQLSPEAMCVIHDDPDVVTANSTRASGKAEAVPDGYRVSGRWSLVSGCELGRWMVLLCGVQENGTPRLLPSGAPETRFALVPSTACEIIDTWTVGGLRGTGSHDVAVRDAVVPAAFTAGFFDPFVLPESRYRYPPFCRVIPGLGAITLGIARTAIESLTELAADKQLQRSMQILRDNHGAQRRVAEAQALVRAARLYLFDAVGRLWSVVTKTGEAPIALRADARMAASHAVFSAAKAIDLMYSAAGATALYTSSPLERAFRDVHAITQHIGVHERVMETAGRVLFGLEPDTPLL